MRLKLSALALGCCLAVVVAPQVAGAGQPVLDPTTLRLPCTAPTVCTGSTVGQITSSGLPTFNVTVQGATGISSANISGGIATGTLFIVVLVPSANPALSFSINGNAASTGGLGVYSSGVLLDGGTGFLAASNYSTANPNFNAWASASGQSGTTPSGFDVYVVNLGTVTINVNAQGTAQGLQTLATITAASYGSFTGFPVGTVIVAYLADGPGGSLFSTSTSVVNSVPLSGTITTVPEPGTMALLGTGLLALGGAVRRRWRKRN